MEISAYRVRRLAFIALTLAVAAGGCRSAGSKSESAASASELGIVQGSMDRSAQPGDDFFAYANGAWVKDTPIPEDRSSIGGFYIADKERERQTRELLDSILKSNPAAGSHEARLATYYHAYLATAAIDRAGLAPARADLDAIAAIADKHQLSTAIGTTLRADTDPLNATNFQTDNLFGIFVTQGLTTPGAQIPYVMQGGIGLPEREYYLSTDAEMVRLRDAYRAYVLQILQLAEFPDAEGATRRILD